MEKVLIVGSTGYLGQCAVRAFKERGYFVRALARNAAKLESVKQYVDETFEGQVTRPETLSGVCDGMDYVFSTLGLTRQKDKLTHLDVDYGGNKNILDQALKASVKKFVYVSVFNPHPNLDITIFKAKEKFVAELKASGMDYAVIYPTAFFSDMAEVFKMARSGRSYIIGQGNQKSNPIDGNDLARICVDALTGSQKDIAVGGPEIYTQLEAAELSFSILGTPPKITKIPQIIVKTIARIALVLLPKHRRGGLEFLMAAFLNDFVAPIYEGKTLKEFLEEYNRESMSD